MTSLTQGGAALADGLGGEIRGVTHHPNTALQLEHALRRVLWAFGPTLRWQINER